MIALLSRILLIAVVLIPLAHARHLLEQGEPAKRMVFALTAWGGGMILALARSRRGGAERPLPLVFPFAMGFLGWQLATWPFATVPAASLDAVLLTLESICFLWLVWELADTPRVRRVLVRGLCAAALVAALFGLAQYEEKFPEAAPGGFGRLTEAIGGTLDRWTGLGNPFAPVHQTDAPGSYFGHTNVAAEFVVIGAVLSGVLALTAFWSAVRERRWDRFFRGIFSALVCAFLLLFILRSGSRAVALAFGAAMVAAWSHTAVHDLVHRPLFGTRLRHLSFHLILILALCGSFWAVAQRIQVSPRSGQVQVTLWERIVSSLDPANTTRRERMDLWGNTWAMAEQNPVFGVGPGNYEVAYPDYAGSRRLHEAGRLNLRRQPKHPHNEYLEILAENGFAGALLVLLAAVACVFPFLRRRNALAVIPDDEDAIALASICGCIAFLVTAAFAFPWHQTGSRAAFLVLAGLCMNLGDQRRTEGLRGPRGLGWALFFGFLLVISAARHRAVFKASETSADVVEGRLPIFHQDSSVGALRAIDQMALRVPDRTDYKLMRGHLYRASGLLAEAESAYLATLERAPALANAWLGLARVRLGRNAPAAARRSVQRALRLQPFEPQICVAAGQILETLGDRNAAIEAHMRGLNNAPDGTDRLQALLALVRLHSSLGNQPSAALCMGRAERLAPGHLAVLEAKAYLLERHQPKSSMCMAAWEKLVQARPRHAEGQLRLAENYLQRGRYQDALVAAEAAWLVDNALSIALYRRAQAQVGLEQLRQARDTLYECMKRVSRPQTQDVSLFERCTKLVRQIEERARKEGLMLKEEDR